MMLDKPSGHIGGHLYAIHDTLYVQRCLVKNLCGPVDSLLTYGSTSLIEQEAKGTDEDKCSKDNHPQTDPDGEFSSDIIYYSIHSLLISSSYDISRLIILFSTIRLLA
jgi:hypothetical protein